jgi:hypothetical protein
MLKASIHASISHRCQRGVQRWAGSLHFLRNKDTRKGIPMNTSVDEVADGIYRISTAVTIPDGPGGFAFNQYLVVDEAPLLFHTGPRRMFPLVREAVGRILPPERLRYIGLSHFGGGRVRLSPRRAHRRQAEKPLMAYQVGLNCINDCGDLHHIVRDWFAA